MELQIEKKPRNILVPLINCFFFRSLLLLLFSTIYIATRDFQDRAGFRPVDRHEIVKEESVEELNAQLVSLVGENGAEMLISAFRSRKSSSGPELAG